MIPPQECEGQDNWQDCPSTPKRFLTLIVLVDRRGIRADHSMRFAKATYTREDCGDLERGYLNRQQATWEEEDCGLCLLAVC